VRLGAALALAASLAAPLAASLGAQGVPRTREDPWRTTRVLKWTLLAVSAGAGLWAWNESRQADQAYAELRRLCRDDAPACTLNAGRYADPRAEALYDRSTAGDARARVGLLAGQLTLFGSVAFFIVDLRHGGQPDNIPYDPPAAAPPGLGPSGGARLRAGVRLALP
jgi:hypothetical protein